MISTRDLSLLPDVDCLRQTLQSMALLDAILSPEWQYRYYSFNADWSPGEQLGSMRNGSGDEFFAHFSSAGCWFKGFVHDCPMSPDRAGSHQSWPAIFDGVPGEFATCLQEPAFLVQDATFCLWRRYSDPAWQIGPVRFPVGHADPDGSESLLSPMDGRPETFQTWASDYYERDISLTAVEHVYAHRPLSLEVIRQLNSERSLGELAADIKQIGYPNSSRQRLGRS